MTYQRYSWALRKSVETSTIDKKVFEMTIWAVFTRNITFGKFLDKYCPANTNGKQRQQ